MNKFKELGLSKKILDVLEELGFLSPTEIQEKTIPLILEGKDLIGHAFTGSGKTLAFGSGIIEKIVPGKGIQALIIAPTRELAVQITKVMNIFAKNTGLKIEEIYGGMDMQKQVIGAKKADIIIGTPGRLLDHLRSGTFKLDNINFLVLDEADRLADMGFLPDIDKIISQCGTKKQVLLFSATVSKDLYHIIKRYMKNPVQISIKNYVDPSKLKQYFYDTPSHLKFSLLVDLLKKEKSGLVMIFCNTRRTVDLIVRNLERQGINSYAIHGGMEQKKRNKIMEKFHSTKVDILVCTDVAARGLDIKGVTHVYNYDLPKTSEEYIHRIGRTARAGEKGLAISILSQKDYDNFRKITDKESIKIEQKELPYVKSIRADFRSDDSGGRSFGRRDSSRSGGRNFGGRGRDNNRREGGSSGRRSGGRSFGRRDSSHSRDHDSSRSGGRSFGRRDSSHSRDHDSSRSGGNRSKSRGRNNNRREGGSSGRRSGGRSFGRRDSSHSDKKNFRKKKKERR